MIGLKGLTIGGIIVALLITWKTWSTDDDYWNPIRKYIWPKIHGFVKKFGGYSLSHVTKNQLVGVVNASEEEMEDILVERGFKTNPIASLKRRMGKSDVSDGSWVYRNAESWWCPDRFASMQLHVTLFENQNGNWVVYAHWEDNFWVKPWKHLDGTNFSAGEGVKMARQKLSDTDINTDPTDEEIAPET